MKNFLIQIKDKNYRCRGITFLELMVTVFILIVGISGTMGLIHTTIAASSMAASRLKATYLAQEGVEVVRNIRDSNWVKDINWLENLSLDSNGECRCCEVAFNSDMVKSPSLHLACPNGNPRLLTFDGQFYSYETSGTTTIFSRRIDITRQGIQGTSSEYLEVKATVFWEARGEINSVIVIENIYNWR